MPVLEELSYCQIVGKSKASLDRVIYIIVLVPIQVCCLLKYEHHTHTATKKSVARYNRQFHFPLGNATNESRPSSSSSSSRKVPKEDADL